MRVIVMELPGGYEERLFEIARSMRLAGADVDVDILLGFLDPVQTDTAEELQKAIAQLKAPELAIPTFEEKKPMRQFWNGKTLRVINNCLLVIFKMFRRGSSETLEPEQIRRLPMNGTEGCRPVRMQRRRRQCLSGFQSSGLRHWYQGKGKRRVRA